MPATQVETVNLDRKIIEDRKTLENATPPDFDLSCFPFKSSFARSLSLTNNNCNNANRNKHNTYRHHFHHQQHYNHQAKSLDYNNIESNQSYQSNQHYTNDKDEPALKSLSVNTALSSLSQKQSNQSGCKTSIKCYNLNKDVEGQKEQQKQQQQQEESQQQYTAFLPIKYPSHNFNNNSQEIENDLLDMHVQQVVHKMENGKMETMMAQFKPLTIDPSTVASVATTNQQQQQSISNKIHKVMPSSSSSQQQQQQQQQNQHQQPYLMSKQLLQQPTSLPYLNNNENALAMKQQYNTYKLLSNVPCNRYQNNEYQYATTTTTATSTTTACRRNSIHGLYPDQNHDKCAINCNSNKHNYEVGETHDSNESNLKQDEQQQQQKQQQQQWQQQPHQIQLTYINSISSNQNINNHDGNHEDEEQQTTIPFHLNNEYFTKNVEIVILQNQIDSLQWQMKQMETSCNMYRALTEEMARFLERYQMQKQHLQQEQQQYRQQQKYNTKSASVLKFHCDNNNPDLMEPSKTLYTQIYGTSDIEEKSNRNTSMHMINEPFTRKTYERTNHENINGNDGTKSTIPIKSKLILNMAKDNVNNHSKIIEQKTAATMFPSHHDLGVNFINQTWKRTPKKLAELRLQMHVDDVEEKLNQHATRLLQTIKNVLNTSSTQRHDDILQQKDDNSNNIMASIAITASTATTNSLSSYLTNKSITNPITTTTTTFNDYTNNGLNIATINKMSSTSNSQLLTSANMVTISSSSSKSRNSNNSNNNNTSGNTNDIEFLRSSNIRDSRISLRSSTDGSVHSTFSSTTSSVSSKIETDEDMPTTATSTTLTKTKAIIKPTVATSASTSSSSSSSSSISSLSLTSKYNQCMTTIKSTCHYRQKLSEDESGFSSLSSFDVGLPLSSTMISKVTDMDNNNTNNNNNNSNNNGTNNTASSNMQPQIITATNEIEQNTFDYYHHINHNIDELNESNNHAMKANILGLPQVNITNISTNLSTATMRYEAPTKAYHNMANTKFQRFSTLTNDDTNNVLWV